jgi:hypothetical protein
MAGACYQCPVDSVARPKVPGASDFVCECVKGYAASREQCVKCADSKTCPGGVVAPKLMKR